MLEKASSFFVSGVGTCVSFRGSLLLKCEGYCFESCKTVHEVLAKGNGNSLKSLNKVS